jgi:hypothetical protein
LNLSVSGPTSPRPLSLLIWLVIIGIALFVTTLVLLHEFPMMVSGAGRGPAPDRLFILLLGGMAGGVALFCYGFVLGQKKRLVETTPTSAIRSLAVGLVEIIGTAELSGPALLAPFSRLSCVFFSYRVEEQQGSGDHRRWNTIAEGASDQPFGTRDATGLVQVFPQGADLMLEDARTYRNDWLGDLPLNVTTGLAALGITGAGWLGQKTLRCHESCLLAGAPVYVLGTAQENTAAKSSVNESRLFIGRARDGQLLISDRMEQDLLTRWGWQIPVCLYGGPTMTVACLFAMFHSYVRNGP